MRSSDSGSSPLAAGISGKHPGRARRAAALAALLACASPAWGFYNDRLEVFFTETATWDSNVFRLPSGVDAERAIGSSSRSDRILTHGVGIAADVPVSLQRFQGSYQHFWARYDRFGRLDFDGDIWRAAWLWAVSSELTGDIGVSETTGLASFALFRGSVRDVITTRQAFASGNWLLTPRWLAHAGVVATERTHENPARRINDVEATSVEARLSYVTPKENHVGVSVRVEEGKAPESEIFQGIAFDNAYSQAGVGVVTRWELTPHSRIDGRFDYVKREYDQFSSRDYSGPAWGITYTWAPTVKLSFATTLRRDIAPLDDVQTSFVTTTGISVKPRWQVTEKFALVGSADYARWKYRGDPLLGAGFEHRVSAGSIGFAWTPYRRVVITGSLQREVRRSDLADADYTVNVGTLDARIGF